MDPVQTKCGNRTIASERINYSTVFTHICDDGTVSRYELDDVTAVNMKVPSGTIDGLRAAIMQRVDDWMWTVHGGIEVE